MTDEKDSDHVKSSGTRNDEKKDDPNGVTKENIEKKKKEGNKKNKQAETSEKDDEMNKEKELNKNKSIDKEKEQQKEGGSMDEGHQEVDTNTVQFKAGTSHQNGKKGEKRGKQKKYYKKKMPKMKNVMLSAALPKNKSVQILQDEKDIQEEEDQHGKEKSRTQSNTID
ncbi:uncharacterized protein LOC132631142 [Lycium barbarum]|uniref:uncharacterized protein LOC132631142 n=1 Tax=Lycium barbarum TaxID=112863 RepID=UPI00293F4135|nr:uncharacterized protein LOC132631142 [Lycium barbarum]